ncbi:MAG: hypothetical protein ABJI22_18785 [Maribacter sp.]
MQEEPTLHQLIDQLKVSMNKKPQIVAQSSIQDKINKAEALRKKEVEKSVKYLSTDLPQPRFNPNERHYNLRGYIVNFAFLSALQNGIVFKRGKGEKLYLTTGSKTLLVKSDDLEEQIEILIKWSGLGNSLRNESGKMPSSEYLRVFLVLRAAKYQRDLLKKKSSTEQLEGLAEKFTVSAKSIERGLLRSATLEKLTSKILKSSDELGLQFSKDASGNLYLVCSDSKFGSTKLDMTKVEPIFQAMIDHSPVVGKLKAANDAKNLISRFTSKQPRC